MATYSSLAPMFAGCDKSTGLELEMWTMGYGEVFIPSFFYPSLAIDRILQIDDLIRPTLPGLASLSLGGCALPTTAFIANELSRAPKLVHLHMYGSTHDNGVRNALALALADDGTWEGVPSALVSSTKHNVIITENVGSKVKKASSSDDASDKVLRFPSLRSLNYPAEDGTYGTGRGRSYREHECENPGEDELKKAAGQRGIWPRSGISIQMLDS